VQKAQEMKPDQPKVNRTLAKIYLDYGQFWEEQREVIQAQDAYQKAKAYGEKAYTLAPQHLKDKDLLQAIAVKYTQFLHELPDECVVRRS
jgi:predicted YcjX-like family ATPase